jgi:hypothetical protein
MNEKCYISAQYPKKRRKAVKGRAFCGFHILRGGFGRSVTTTVFGTRPKGV